MPVASGAMECHTRTTHKPNLIIEAHGLVTYPRTILVCSRSPNCTIVGFPKREKKKKKKSRKPRESALLTFFWRKLLRGDGRRPAAALAVFEPRCHQGTGYCEATERGLHRLREWGGGVSLCGTVAPQVVVVAASASQRWLHPPSPPFVPLQDNIPASIVPGIWLGSIHSGFHLEGLTERCVQ
jgi:hypothetical protein